MTVANSTIAGNRATGGNGEDGGDGLGGAIWNGSGSALTLDRATIAGNQALGGAAGPGGKAGFGIGGGIYNLRTALVDPATDVFGNEASTSNDDCFGVSC